MNTGCSPEIYLSVVRYQIIRMFTKYQLTIEPVRKMNEIYYLFKIKSPATIEYTTSEDKLKRVYAVLQNNQSELKLLVRIR